MQLNFFCTPFRSSVTPLVVAGLTGLTTIAAFPAQAVEQKEEVMKKLPPPKTKGELSVEEAIAARRSIRSYSGAPLSEVEISQLLWAAQGITDPRRGFRAAPSAGATYPLETYLVTAEGVFRYDPDRHALQPIRMGDARARLATAAYGQSFVEKAGATVVFAAVPERTTRRYGKRGQMYIHMEAGHAAQNVHLQAVALGLGSVPVGAFEDAKVAGVLDLPAGQIPLYLICVGR